MSGHEVYVPTRFLSYTTTEDGTLILHSSLTGALGAVPSYQADEVKAALKRTSRVDGPLIGVLNDLREGGFLIPEGTDESEIRHQLYLNKYRNDSLHLIIMPTEQCNFRCVYCYESFLRGTMSPEIVEGIKKYVASQENLKRLDVGWFGGEPLLAPSVVTKLTQHFYAYCLSQGIDFSASITTNGSLLTEELVESLVPYGVKYFQITLDGVEEEHDQRRVSIDGHDSFARIIKNLRYLKSTSYTFIVSLRHNFDPDGLTRLEEYIDMLKNEFGGDPRFTTMFEAIGTWGGANDDELTVCEGRAKTQSLMQAKRLAIEAGFHNSFELESLQPGGFVCYAANPRSFVIGADGKLYKCTVELDYHDRNIVGQLHPNGTMELNWQKMSLWVETNGMDDGKKCRTCFFSPSCYGAVCPKDWMDQGDCDCPGTKLAIGESLKLIQLETSLPKPIELSMFAKCTK